MELILSQADKFELLGDVDTQDNTLQQERALQAFLLRASKEGHITKEQYQRIRPTGSQRPRMYGVPKLHKTGIPLRPILSMIRAPQHELAKWLAEILKPVVDKYSEHAIRDTFEFCENIENFSAENDTTSKYMCSFDIASLFTNIPLTETIQICMDTLYRNDEIQKPSVPERLLKSLLIKATTEVIFSFNNKIYKQVDGVAMGSPLGPILANIFVGHCENKIEAQNWPDFYNRFVDDTFSIFDSVQKSRDFFELLNNLHPALKFTVEGEVNHELPFMDVAVKRENEGLTRTVYRKPTFTGQYMRWESFAPTQQKIGLIRSLTSRALKICSKEKLQAEICTLKQIFTDNGYPTDVVDRVVFKTCELQKMCHDVAATTSEEVSMRTVVLRLPWIGHKSTECHKEIERVITRSFNLAKPRIVFTTRKAFTVGGKDVLPIFSQSNVIYDFTCRCGRAYVGRTTQRLGDRAKQHIPDKLLQTPALRSAKQPCKADSGITKHLKQSNSCIEPTLRDNFKIIAKGRNEDHLEVLEAIFIRRNKPDLCLQKEHTRTLALV